MASIKHVGRVKKTKKKVVVAYRTIPGDAYSCVVIPTESLMADEHDALMKAVESNAGQTAGEFAEAMMRHQLPDGRNMLLGLHQTGRMTKMRTEEIEMTPTTTNVVGLDELNQLIADQKGVALEDLAIKDTKRKNDLTVEEHNLDKVDVPVDTPPEVVAAANEANNEVLSDEELAAKYRSDADRMFKEAKALREQAEALVPTKKKTAKSKESA